MVEGKHIDFEYFKSTTPGSKLNQLYNRMDVDSYVRFSMENYREMLNLCIDMLGKLTRSEAAIIEIDFAAEASRRALCFAHGINIVRGNAKQIHIARELLAQGMATSIYSHQIHPYVENIFSYLFRTGLEAGLY